jgi:hypothetical protein
MVYHSSASRPETPFGPPRALEALTAAATRGSPAEATATEPTSLLANADGGTDLVTLDWHWMGSH